MPANPVTLPALLFPRLARNRIVPASQVMHVHGQIRSTPIVILMALRETMSMQNKAQMVEAVLFFNDRGVCKEMLFPEVRGAAFDNVVNMPEFADQQMRLAMY